MQLLSASYAKRDMVYCTLDEEMAVQGRSFHKTLLSLGASIGEVFDAVCTFDGKGSLFDHILSVVLLQQ